MNEDFGAKLDQILADPAMLAQIKALADTMTANTKKAEETAPAEASDAPAPRETSAEKTADVSASALPSILSPSPALEENLKHTRELLVALKPFLDQKRCEKIDKMLSMMRLAEMAGQFGNLL